MGVIFAKEGVDTTRAALSPDFDGCACCVAGGDTGFNADVERAAAFFRARLATRGFSAGVTAGDPAARV